MYSKHFYRSFPTHLFTELRLTYVRCCSLRILTKISTFCHFILFQSEYIGTFSNCLTGFQVVEDGYEFFSNRQLVTIFSAPNYCGEFDNDGSMMTVDQTLMCSFQILKPLEKKPKFIFGSTTLKTSTPSKIKVNFLLLDSTTSISLISHYVCLSLMFLNL
ncbi:putative protein-serine/threonine phosphatase [Lupinus albus]|uniref:protein-serine/threonine phosphatase n=1 Tax=Lupinus albus TaxID=3870 RepID=A0A6A4QVW4_LUPAL|nr:putative protein-serine/threonine phosphatase [Lupinus albus]